MRVTAWQRTQRMEFAASGSCSGAWQLEQLTCINMGLDDVERERAGIDI